MRVSVPARRTAALLAVAAGLMLVIAGTAGFVVTRHPQTIKAMAITTLPIPKGTIVAAPRLDTAPVAEPVSLTIPSIGVQTQLIHLGLTSSGALQVPPTTAVAGWYTGSPRPGAIGSSVIAGHIDSYLGPGVFYHLSQLRTGDRVYIRRADGTLAAFSVTRVEMYSKDKFPTEAVYGPTPDAELRLITCGGTFDPALGSYLSNVVVFATEVS